MGAALVIGMDVLMLVRSLHCLEPPVGCLPSLSQKGFTECPLSLTGADDCVLARRLRLLDILDDVRRVRPADPRPHLLQDWARPLPHLHRDWACHICTWTALTPTTSAPGLGSPSSTSAPGLGSPAASFAPGAAAALIAPRSPSCRSAPDTREPAQSRVARARAVSRRQSAHMARDGAGGGGRPYDTGRAGGGRPYGTGRAGRPLPAPPLDRGLLCGRGTQEGAWGPSDRDVRPPARRSRACDRRAAANAAATTRRARALRRRGWAAETGGCAAGRLERRHASGRGGTERDGTRRRFAGVGGLVVAVQHSAVRRTRARARSSRAHCSVASCESRYRTHWPSVLRTGRSREYRTQWPSGGQVLGVPRDDHAGDHQPAEHHR